MCSNEDFLKCHRILEKGRKHRNSHEAKYFSWDKTKCLEKAGSLGEASHSHHRQPGYLRRWASRLLGQRALRCCVLAEDLPPFPPVRRGWPRKDLTKRRDSRAGEGRNGLCREDFAALIILSLGVSRSFAGGMGRAADERSNSLENCLTLLLYFWMFPHGQGLFRSWFPPEVSCLGMHWILWNLEG